VWDCKEILQKKNILRKSDVQFMLSELPGNFPHLESLKEVKRSVKTLVIEAAFGSSEALQQLQEKEKNAGKDTLIGYKHVFGENIPNLSALKADLPLDIAIAAIYSDESGIDWSLLKQWMDADMDESKKLAGFYALVQDQLRVVGHRETMKTLEDVDAALTKKRSRGSGSDSDGAKRTKFSSLPDQKAHMIVDDPSTDHGLALWNKIASFCAHGTDSIKMQYIKKTISRREQKAATDHAIWMGLSKEMKLYVSDLMVAPPTVEAGPEPAAEAEDKTSEEEPSSEEATSEEEEEPSSAEEEVDFAEYNDDLDLSSLEDILVPTANA
jgi:hypothetical protein